MKNRILDVKQKSSIQISKEKKCSKAIIVRRLEQYNILKRTCSEVAQLIWLKKKNR